MKTTFLGTVLVLLCLVACRQENGLEWSETPYLNVHSPWVDSTLQTLSLEDKIGQLLYVEVQAGKTPQDWSQLARYGGFQVYGLSANDYQDLQQQIAGKQAAFSLQGTEEQVLLNAQFGDSGDFPGADALSYLPEDDSLRQLSRKIFNRQMQSLGINAQFSPFNLLMSPAADLMAAYHLQFVKNIPADRILQPADTAYWDEAVRLQLQELQNRGVAGFALENGYLEAHDLSPLELADLFRKQLDFKGLLVAEAQADNAINLLAGTVDMLRVKQDPAPVFQKLLEAYQKGTLKDRELDVRVAKILQAKEWLRQQQQVLREEQEQLAEAKREVTYDRASVLAPVLGSGNRNNKVDSLEEDSAVSLSEHFNKNRWRQFNRQFYEKSSVLLYNRQQLLPFRDLYKNYYRLVHLGGESRQAMENAFSHYADFSKSYHVANVQGQYPSLRLTASKKEICVVTINETLDGKGDSLLLADLKQLATDREVVLVHFGDDAGLQALDTTFTILHFPEMNSSTQELAAQTLFGGASPQGKLPHDINAYFHAGEGEELPVTRLSYQFPEALGIAPEKLVGIDAIVQSAIAEGAFPGCQVLVAKNGAVVYSKAFGYHDYEQQQKVETTDLYDLASITKVAATTLVAMKLYELGKFDVDERLKTYLDCPSNSTIKNIPIKKLLIHQSGLQPHMPVIPYLLYRDMYNVGCDSFFCNKQSEEYPYQIAENMFFSKKYHDKIWDDIHRMAVGSQRRYRYSDANFFLIQQVLEKVGGTSLDELINQYFYTPLGLRYTTYRPLERFTMDHIVPTQQDKRWRQQLVQGFVHDETAALLGGVAGHAGLFTDAEDLAVIFQMLLNGGYYGDRQYLKPETIELFTLANHGNHRGFGFDTAHPDSRSAFSHSASERTFGHTGFTGTCVWADPNNDLIFIFLSNRINPDARNKKLFTNRVRERIHQVVYDALDTYEAQEVDKGIVME